MSEPQIGSDLDPRVAAFLAELQMAEYAAKFRANDITLDLLWALTDSELQAIGVSSLGHRKKLLAAIHERKPVIDTGLSETDVGQSTNDGDIWTVKVGENQQYRTVKQMREEFSRGAITLDALVRRPGTPDWTPLRNMKSLAAAVGVDRHLQQTSASSEIKRSQADGTVITPSNLSVLHVTALIAAGIVAISPFLPWFKGGITAIDLASRAGSEAAALYSIYLQVLLFIVLIPFAAMRRLPQAFAIISAFFPLLVIGVIYTVGKDVGIRPKDFLKLATIGPYVSLVCGVVFACTYRPRRR